MDCGLRSLQRREKPRDDGDVALAQAKARDPDAGDRRARIVLAQNRFELVDAGAVRLGHEDVGLGGSRTSRSSATYAASTPASARSSESSIPVSAMYSDLGGSRLRAPTSATSACANDAVVEQHPQRHPPEVPGRRRLGRVQIAVRVDPDDPEPVRRDRPDRVRLRRGCSSILRGRRALAESISASASLCSVKCLFARRRRPPGREPPVSRLRPSPRRPLPRRAERERARRRTSVHSGGTRSRRRSRPP